MIVEMRVDEHKLIATMSGLTGEIDSSKVEVMKQQHHGRTTRAAPTPTQIRMRTETKGFQSGSDVSLK
jgi:hypothetical protein